MINISTFINTHIHLHIEDKIYLNINYLKGIIFKNLNRKNKWEILLLPHFLV